MPHISDRMLSKALKELEEDKFISKEIFAEVPVRTEYSITKKGKECIPIIKAIRNLGLKWMDNSES